MTEFIHVMTSSFFFQGPGTPRRLCPTLSPTLAFVSSFTLDIYYQSSLLPTLLCIYSPNSPTHSTPTYLTLDLRSLRKIALPIKTFNQTSNKLPLQATSWTSLGILPLYLSSCCALDYRTWQPGESGRGKRKTVVPKLVQAAITVSESIAGLLQGLRIHRRQDE